MSEEEKKKNKEVIDVTMSEDEKKMKEREAEIEAKAEVCRQEKIVEARTLIETMDISCAPDISTPITPGNLEKCKVKLQTNLFGIRMTDDYHIFKYDIFIGCDIGSGEKVKHIEFTKKGRGDAIVSDRRRKCMAIFNSAIKEAEFYREDIMFYYDGQSIMYTLEKLVFPDETKPNTTVIIEGEKVSKELVFFKHIYVQIKECSDSVQSRISDIRKIDRDIMRKDRSAMQFVDVVTSMQALSDSDRFTVFANGKIFPNRPDLEKLQSVKMKEGKVMIPGLTKAMKLIEGPRGRNNASPALAVDSLKVAFHAKEKVIDKAMGFFLDINKPSAHEIQTFAQMVKGLGCTTNHTKTPRQLEIHGISRENSSKKVEVDLPCALKRNCSVAEYFVIKYSYTLKFPLAPLVMSRERGNINLYPMELLDVIPMQRVTIPQTTSIQSQVATKECAVPPGVRQKNIDEQCKLHGLFDPEQKFLKAAGLSIIPIPLKVEARVLRGPVLQYKSSNMEVLTPQWRPPMNYQFAVPSVCNKWSLYAITAPRDSLTVDDMNRFADAFTKRCRERGMTIGAPEKVEILPEPPINEQTKLPWGPDYPARMKIKESNYEKNSFIMFISNEFHAVHKHIKLQERYSNVLTQDLKLKTVMQYLAKSQHLTMDNIIYKTNLKLGGMNYGLSLKNVVGNYNPFPANRLILGISVSHAPRVPNIHQGGTDMTPAAVVGYCANMANFPTEFVGDYIFQDAKHDDILLCTAEMLQNVIDRFTGALDPETRIKGPPKKPLPKDVILYRQGLSEGFYGMCLTEEVPLIKAVLAKNGATETKLTYIIVQKEHSVRLMPEDFNPHEKPTQQNIGSGVVMDSQITHPRFKEFFLNSHVTLQGTARTPRYTVLFDDAKLAMNELEMVTYALAFNFQIVNSPVSIPAPLYIANRYSERGVAVYTAKASDEMASTDQKVRITLKEMNEDLPFKTSPLGGSRINA